ncbi:hypothetical protein IU449_25795 [Nocardia higoensis]|uniref:Uncharacterized protein n=1 Tax=Nocardia higoensis TaxID=228599 RepID=A0ABS0DLK1_9NOCA|nr:hypothetical protein [Nocardia higoensis]MBF6357914.1 hypothetical protein [Nocardia higoensis]
MRIGSAIVLIWLFVGVVAAVQRDYLEGSGPSDCAGFGTLAVTVIAGPLNYMGVNPKIDDCELPELPEIGEPSP